MQGERKCHELVERDRDEVGRGGKERGGVEVVEMMFYGWNRVG
jgi:hypothetical protein